jgi:hypothetical protein
MPGGQNICPPAEARPAQAWLPVPVTSIAAPNLDGHCPVCLEFDDHDEWNAGARGETPLQRVDRAYGEILQEVRVAQTGVQILFAFLLALAFTARFAAVTGFQRYLYVLTLLLCAGSAALLIAPAAYHRMIYRRRLKHHLVRAANRLALSGLMMLLLAIVSALLLILDVVLGHGPALFLGTGALAWFVAWWFVLPVWSRLRHHSLISGQDVGVAPRAPAGRDGPAVPAGHSAEDPGADGGPSPEDLDASAPFAGQDAAGVNPLSDVGRNRHATAELNGKPAANDQGPDRRGQRPDPRPATSEISPDRT